MLSRLFLILAAASAAWATQCVQLTQVKIPDVTIESAAVQTSGSADFNGSPLQAPTFCRVLAVARPVPDSEIHMEIWLPEASAWNGKFLGTGNGGYSSALNDPAMANALNRGYATAGSDTGHSGADLHFGLGHPEKVIDFAYRATHLMTTTAKLLVHEAMGRSPDESYFSSCSTGGHQAMSEVERYPDDYNGVIAGAPANNRIGQTFAFLYGWLALHDAQDKPLLTTAELKLVTHAVIESCDAKDGLRDGLVDDPRRCDFDPESLVCGKTKTVQCLTEQQAAAIRKVYAGLKNPRTGEQVFAGWPKGSEWFGESPIQSWRMYLLEPAHPMRTEVLQYFVFHDPNWDWHKVDFDKDVSFARKEIPFMDALNTDLTPFAKRGGKLILYGGWADPVVPAAETVRYYDSVTKTMGGLEKTQQFSRLFLAPGMGHCGGGIGPNKFEPLAALDKWVTKGIAPESMVASHESSGKVDRTRILCAYPKVARYKGTGGIDDAAHFFCATHKQ